MKTLYLLITIIIGLILTGCSSSNPPSINSNQPKTKITPTKNPLAVSFYQNPNEVKHPYKVIGTETVSKYNKAGVKRQEATIRDAMRSIAATMGGDAVITVSRDNKYVQGTIVSFEKNSTSPSWS